MKICVLVKEVPDAAVRKRVDPATGRSLVDSMINEVIVRDTAIRDLMPFELTAYDDAVRAALAERRPSGGASR